MNESLHDYMKVGLIHFMAFPDPEMDDDQLHSTFEEIAYDTFFEAVAVKRLDRPSARKNAVDLFKSASVDLVYGAHPRILGEGFNLNSLDQAAREAAVAAMKEEFDQAVEMGAVAFVFLSGPFDPDQREAHLSGLVESTQEICAYAKERGNIQVALEVFDHSIDKKSLIGPAPLALEYAERVSEEFDNFGLVVDLSHIPLIGESPEEALIPVRDHLIAVDIGNCLLDNPSDPRYGDKHPRFGYPGGVNDAAEVAEFLRVLLDIGFLNKQSRPIVSFEVKPGEGEDPKAVIANAKRTLIRAWSMLSPKN